LPNQSQWQTFTKGSSFAVPKDSSFKLQQLMTLQPKYAYLTHFNRIEFTQKSATMLATHIDGVSRGVDKF
jgi:hypothetical protein